MNSGSGHQLLGIRNDWKSNPKQGASANRALRFDGAAMHLHDPVSDSQTESRAAGFTGTSLIGAIEPFENMGQIFGINAYAGIANLDAGASRSVRKIHFNAA